jgi:hypothetical protein|tara:strand:+ start:69 stop:632 length:564 start_codon:yes stop_codon:yes gene_type:complete
MVSKQKQVDMSRGILQLEMEVLEWNRKMLIDHMGYSNYRDINAFIDMLISNKHVKSSSEGKNPDYRSTGSGEVWLQSKKEGKPANTDETAAAGDNISILIDRFSCNWGGRLPLEEEYTKYTTPFLRQRVPWLISDEFYLYGVNRQGSHEVFPGTTNPLNGWHNSSSSRTARDRYLSLSIEELLLQEV